MTGILEKIETLAKEVGTDVIGLWDEFEAFVRSKLEPKVEAVEPTPGVEQASPSVEPAQEPPAAA